MSWLKVGDNFTEEAADLSDSAFRLHVDGLVYVMRNETGGYIPARRLRRVSEARNRRMALRELLEEKFWIEVEGGYQIVHAMADQPTPEEIRARREHAAERKRQQRRRSLGLDPVSQRDAHGDSRGESQPESQGESGSGPGRLTGRGVVEGGSGLPQDDPAGAVLGEPVVPPAPPLAVYDSDPGDDRPVMTDVSSVQGTLARRYREAKDGE